MRIALVIQRYGLEVSGGSELHCRWLAEHLAREHLVEVFTTRARDYVEWGDLYPEGTQEVGGIPVHRFTPKKRNLRVLAGLSERVFSRVHTRQEEEDWFRANGPESPELEAALAEARDRFDRFVFYSFRYHQVFAGLPPLREKAILVPTAEEDPALSLEISRELLRMPRALVYLTPEEKALVEAASGNRDRPNTIIGTGLDLPAFDPREDIEARFSLKRPFLLYVGRIDRNKGCPTLFAYFKRFLDETKRDLDLVLGGAAVIPIPKHPRIRHVGRLTDGEKVAALRSCSVFVMPSALESLSIVLLEAWSQGAPALVNARCRVLEGQSRRAMAGLYYKGYEEFRGALEFLLDHPEISKKLGEQGRAFVEAECAWTTVLEKFSRALA